MEKPSVTVGEAVERAHKALTPKPSSPAPKLIDVVQRAYGEIMDAWNKYVQAQLEAAGKWDVEIGVTRSAWKDAGAPTEDFLTTGDATRVLLDKKLRFKKPIVTVDGTPVCWVWFNPSTHDKVLMEREKKKKTVLPQVERTEPYDEKEWAKLVADHKGDVGMSGSKPVSVAMSLAPDPVDPPADLDQFKFRLPNVYPMELVRCMHANDRNKNGVKGKLYEQLGHDVQLDTCTLTGLAEEGWQSSLSVKLSHQEYARESAWTTGPNGNVNTSKVYVVEDDEVYVFELEHPGNFEIEKERWCRKFYELVRPQLKTLVPSRPGDSWIDRNGMYERVPGRCPTCNGPKDTTFIPEMSYWLVKEGDTVIVEYGYGGGGTRSWFPLAKRKELHDTLEAVKDAEAFVTEGTKPLPWKWRNSVNRPYVHVKFGEQQFGWFPFERLDDLIRLLGDGFDERGARDKGVKLLSDEGRRQAESKSKASKKLRDDAKRLAEMVVEEPDPEAPPKTKDLFRGQ